MCMRTHVFVLCVGGYKHVCVSVCACAIMHAYVQQADYKSYVYMQLRCMHAKYVLYTPTYST